MSEIYPFDGAWSYRSLHNNPDLETDFRDLRFGAGTLELTSPAIGVVAGSLGGSGWRLEIVGSQAFGNPFSVRFQGKGEIGGELWVYDYIGWLVPHWPHGVEQRDAIVGSVIRTVPHSGGKSPAGYVASFYAVRQ